MVLGIIIYLQIVRSVSVDEFLMGMHIRETGSLTRTGLSHLVTCSINFFCGGLMHVAGANVSGCLRYYF